MWSEFCGIADPKIFAKGKAERKDLPFANHEPGFVVDLDAVPFGSKVASVMTMELLAH